MISERFKEAFIEAGGTRIRYREAGHGDSIVYLHEAGNLQLSPALELLVQTFRVIVFELPGSGSASVEDRARAVNAAVAALGLERYNVIGSSSESQVALWMAILRPESVEAIVLSAPSAPPSDASFELRAAELQQPVLVLFGTVDKTAPPDGGRLYCELLKSCHVMLVYGAGEAIDADRPEAFASLVGDFLVRKEQFVVSQTSALIFP